MSKAIYHRFADSIVIHYDGKTFSVSKDDKRFKLICKMIKEDAVDAAGMIADPNGGYLKVQERLLEALGVNQ